MDAKRTLCVYWLTVGVSVLTLGGAAIIPAQRGWWAAVVIWLFCVRFSAPWVARNVVQRFGLSLERSEKEEIPVPAPPVEPPHKSQVMVYKSDIHTQSGVFVAKFTCLGAVVWIGATMAVFHPAFSQLLRACGFWLFLAIPCGALTVIPPRGETNYCARVDEEKAVSNIPTKRSIAWHDVTSCQIERRYGVTGQIEECTITLVDERNQNWVVLSPVGFLKEGGKKEADDVTHFVRWKLSWQQKPSPVTGETLS